MRIIYGCGLSGVTWRRGRMNADRLKRGCGFLPLALTFILLSLASCGGGGGDNPPDDTTPKPYTCSGTPATCLRFGSGWTYEGVILSQSQTGNGGPDPYVIRLDDGRYRLYYAVADTPADPDWWGMVSWISSDGLTFAKESGYRFEGYTLYAHCVVRNPDGSYRMYWLDQKQGAVNNMGYKAVKSAISTDGGSTFVADPGERLTYSGTGYETNGIGGGRVVLLNNGQFRMYYGGVSDYGRTLSALSSDGLNFTREAGVRLDKLCPPESEAPGIMPVIDALGTFHTFTRAVRCTGNYVNTKAGLFDGTTPDGLTINIDASPFVQGYSKDGTVANSVEPEDFTVVQTPDGLRVYFILYNAGKIIPETALYSVINTSIK
jgi:hypothetical protein